ncbi:indole-3-pyruvate monooxygenase YUCCA10 [Spatholobus suberectus]|nr:indole-3-pyruvate monooxygenase YUCCA10 [Spatholobus suberectus]
MVEVIVVIVGAGPSGLAISACLSQTHISHIILEKEDCNASLWRKNTYDRLNLHLASEFCYLPLMPHPPSAPTFLSKAEFIQYIDTYVAHFNINPLYCRLVEFAMYDEVRNKWRIEAKNTREDTVEVYIAKFLVIATGENSEGYIPDVPGLGSFKGEIVHSKYYKSGSKYESKEVLVVGCGNSGIEITYDLYDWGASSYIAIRSPVHILTKELIHQGLRFSMLEPIGKIKEGAIKVIPSHIVRIENKKVIFGNSEEKEFDAIVFATGYKSIANTWLKDYKYALNDEGLPKNDFPNHWKGDRGLYCAGLLRRSGLSAIKMDAEAIADNINQTLKLP